MRKILSVLSILLLLAGVAQAVEMNQAVTSELTSQNKGRSRATDSSVIIKVWQGDALTNAGVGVSSGTVLKLYTDTRNVPTGITLLTSASDLDTVGEIVDYINTNFSTDSSVEFYASVGPDGYRDMPSHSLTAADISVPGITKANASTIATGNSRLMSAGVEATDGVTPRIKSVSYQIPAYQASYVTLAVWDGNTRIWQRTTGMGAYNSNTADSASPNSVTFPEAKGISATKGNSIVAVATTNANVDTDTVADAVNNIAIVYDQYRD